jgi:hypothetical protein
MNNLRKRLRYVFMDMDSVQLALISGMAFLMWGLVLVMPYDTFVTAETFDTMASLADEWIWGMAFMLLGALQVSSVFMYGHWMYQAIVNFAGFFFLDFRQLHVPTLKPLQYCARNLPHLCPIEFR